MNEPYARLAREIASADGDASAIHAARVLREYRPRLVAAVGETITERVLDHPALPGFLHATQDDLEPEEAVHRAADYLHAHDDASAPDAFTAVRLLIADGEA